MSWGAAVKEQFLVVLTSWDMAGPCGLALQLDASRASTRGRQRCHPRSPGSLTWIYSTHVAAGTEKVPHLTATLALGTMVDFTQEVLATQVGPGSAHVSQCLTRSCSEA